MIIGFEASSCNAFAMFSELAESNRERQFVNGTRICEWILITIGALVVIGRQYAQEWVMKIAAKSLSRQLVEFFLRLRTVAASAKSTEIFSSPMSVSGSKSRLYVHAHR